MNNEYLAQMCRDGLTVKKATAVGRLFVRIIKEL